MKRMTLIVPVTLALVAASSVQLYGQRGEMASYPADMPGYDDRNTAPPQSGSGDVQKVDSSALSSYPAVMINGEIYHLVNGSLIREPEVRLGEKRDVDPRAVHGTGISSSWGKGGRPHGDVTGYSQENAIELNDRNNTAIDNFVRLSREPVTITEQNNNLGGLHDPNGSANDKGNDDKNVGEKGIADEYPSSTDHERANKRLSRVGESQVKVVEDEVTGRAKDAVSEKVTDKVKEEIADRLSRKEIVREVINEVKVVLKKMGPATKRLLKSARMVARRLSGPAGIVVDALEPTETATWIGEYERTAERIGIRLDDLKNQYTYYEKNSGQSRQYAVDRIQQLRKELNDEMEMFAHAYNGVVIERQLSTGKSYKEFQDKHQQFLQEWTNITHR